MTVLDGKSGCSLRCCSFDNKSRWKSVCGFCGKPVGNKDDECLMEKKRVSTEDIRKVIFVLGWRSCKNFLR